MNSSFTASELRVYAIMGIRKAMYDKELEITALGAKLKVLMTVKNEPAPKKAKKKNPNLKWSSERKQKFSESMRARRQTTKTEPVAANGDAQNASMHTKEIGSGNEVRHDPPSGNVEGM